MNDKIDYLRRISDDFDYYCKNSFKGGDSEYDFWNSLLDKHTKELEVMKEEACDKYYEICLSNGNNYSTSDFDFQCALIDVLDQLIIIRNYE